MLKGNAGPEMRCSRCARPFWPRVIGYWFLLLSPRGRGRMPGARQQRAVLCLTCGQWLQEQLESWGVVGEFCFVEPAQAPEESELERRG
jgi:hypothetical protein